MLDAVTAFIKLFCKSARIHEGRSIKSGKSTAYYQVKSNFFFIYRFRLCRISGLVCSFCVVVVVVVVVVAVVVVVVPGACAAATFVVAVAMLLLLLLWLL